ncbi:MAG TPA: cell division protein SepF [Candidatus Nanoarchaeia archaeon]|nr:cell division protein SepF [Candidatus Nanoarchaeia archaeon]
MAPLFGDLKKIFTTQQSEVELGEDYVELEADIKDQKSKVLVRPFTLVKFEDIKDVLLAIREGMTISILNIEPLKDKDLAELKRAIDKIKKTVEANEGDIAGFGENFLVVTPSFAKVWRAGMEQPQAAEGAAQEDEEL